ncbi:MAG TPA: 6-phosphogluconolactonase [Pyrinomonadaceae bacterium]|nr:6-phosphogluconolactonase [Pyrinomonadaceae bacterium]
MKKAPRIEIANDEASFARLAADLFLEIGRVAIERHGEFNVALSGGSTPKGAYELLASERYRNKLAWEKVRFYFGDERNVPPDHTDSNFRMAKEAMLDPIGISNANVVRWRTEWNDPDRTAEEYEKVLAGLGMPPAFDLILLGLGEDGHIASLFLGSEGLKETERMAVANWVPDLKEYRFTLTFPAINSALNIVYLVSGGAKAGVVKRVINGPANQEELPAAGITPENGSLIWLLDQGAASKLGEPADLHLTPNAP